MRIQFPLLGLCLSFLLVSHGGAAPTVFSDDMDRFLSDKGLLVQLDQVRQSVGEKASDLVMNAMGFLGVPYRRGGNTVETGFDCSGFVRAMYEQTIGLLLPRRADEQAAVTQAIDRNDLKPGDLVFFNTMRHAFSHVGIYVGDNKFIHSPKPGSEVRVEDMRVAYWERRFTGARRVPASGNQPNP
jgi:cell wall-associated NlpC family hydrolase